MRLSPLFLCFALAFGAHHQRNRKHIDSNDDDTTAPHVILIAIDDLGYTDLGYMGAEYATPNIDALSQDGVKLNNYYVEPTCTPTRTAFLTGRYPFRSGMQSLKTIFPGAKIHIPLDTPTVAELLHNKGYQTAMVGKWHLGYSSWAYTPTRRGFDSFVGFFQGGQFYYDHTVPSTVGNHELGYDFWKNEEVFNVTGQYSLDVFHNASIDAITNRNKSQPMFLYLSFQTVHAPLEAPPPNQADYKACESVKSVQTRWVYCLKMQALDRSIGEIISVLKSEGMWDNAVGIFSTDNGGMVKVDLPNFTNNFTMSDASNYPLRGGKATCFEGGVKGAGFMFGGHKSLDSFRGTAEKSLFHAVDVPATLLAAANVDLPSNFDGIDIVGVTAGTTAPRTVLPHHIEELGFANSAIRSGDWKLIAGTPVYDGYFQPGKPVTYVQNCTKLCLFNITADPNETTDLSKSFPQVVRQLRALIESFVLSGDYKASQPNQVYNESLPENHGGVWAPWE